MAPPTPEQLVRDLVGGRGGTTAALLEAAETSGDPTVLVAAALVAADRPDLLGRASAAATCTRDRQLVAVAAAHLRGEDDLTLLLARDHLADHPDAVLVAYIAALSVRR
jgi:molybdopterin-guanine dinucleotide biosynthesis protein A